jgi:hypothetical protein|tara:strand:- start:265 stop:561 length:297 start_codon:yes stop_codon:yes gene_type:complete
MLGCSTAYAEPYWASKPVQCGTAQELIDMSLRFGERPILKLEGTTMNTTGAITPSKIVIAWNKETDTWTLMEFPSSGMGCILSTGKGLENIPEKGTSL